MEQAGEKDSESETHLARVFIDLDVSTHQGKYPRELKFNVFLEKDIPESSTFPMTGLRNSFSVMDSLLKENYPKIVIIGGPGQGKSTIGQQIAQVHRAQLLYKPYDDNYQPKTPRIPFHVVLKDFAQWLANEPEIAALNSYLAQKVGKLAKRPEEVKPQDIQEILRKRDCMLILDGLDEVVVPKLQKQMLKCVHDFLADAENLGAKVMVVATSRPNGYDNQFDPEKFWHLELKPLSQQKVTEYAQRWIKAKKLNEDERNKIIPILEDCQNDASISGLLATPLQVTIILIIIRSGRRPPSQREDLFNEYWLTIFRREEGKDGGKDIIKNKESHLLNIHAYLAYILHRRAADENIQSFLSEEEFKSAVSDFLRKKKGRYFSKENITSEVEQLVQEVGDRLVLIVQKQKGFYGFELRSFQEFFAAVHLVHTAEDTTQRVDRLKAIIPYEHWRNVSLFFAGRMARTFQGEVAKLEQVWRAVDRDGINRYLQPGAWFALQIAADGALSDETDLQYSAIEDSLKILEIGLTNEQQNKLKSYLGKLTNQEQEKCLKQILEDKICRSLPEIYLANALDIYSDLFGVTELFMTKIDSLVHNSWETVINSALKIALDKETDPAWIAKRLNNDSFKFVVRLFMFNQTSHNYRNKLLYSLGLSANQFNKLAKISFNHRRYSYGQFIDLGDILVSSNNKDINIIIEEPKSPLEQLILAQKCDILFFLNYQDTDNFNFDETTIKEVGKFNEADIIEKLLKSSGLKPWLQMSLWRIFWLFNKPTRENTSVFLENLWNIQESKLLPEYFKYPILIANNWPLLNLAVEVQRLKGKDAINSLIPFLDWQKQLSVEKEVKETILPYLEKVDETQKKIFFHAINTKIKLDKFLPNLVSLAARIGITLGQLVNAHARYLIGNSNHIELTSTQFQDLLKACEEAFESQEQLLRLLNYITNESVIWSSDSKALGQAQQLLEKILTNWSKLSTSQNSRFDPTTLTVSFFLKLLAYNIQAQQIVANLFQTISQDKLLKIRHSFFRKVINLLSTDSISILKSLLTHENESVCRGSTILFAKILDATKVYGKTNQQLNTMRFDPNLGSNWIDANETKLRQVGITLLTWSDYPIEDTECQKKLSIAFQHSKISEEERAWANFLKNVPIDQSKEQNWSRFLEGILAEPKPFGSLILSAAMERYQKLNSTVSVTISQEEEKRLGLP
ncbi:MAG: NACHT domain-containing protein [Symploca sp. SIO2D2]|nr:NACHT domain-containing protein [Symploca sp. SIO2D2]